MNSSTDPYAAAASAADSADEAMQQTARQAIDLLTDSLNTAKDQAVRMWDDMRPQLDKVASYAKEEPTKSVLMAAVAGALIVTVVMASRRSRIADVDVDVDASTQWMKKLASDAADRARSLAQDKAERAAEAAEAAQSTARSKLRDLAATAADEAKSMKDSAMDTARRAASQAYDGVSDRLHDLRDKADPLIEQIQPQLDNVAGYAKKNPLSALLVATLAGALLSRLAK